MPRTLADIIQDAFRPCVVTAARQLQQGVLILGTGPDGLPLARFARARLQGLIGEADMTAVLVLAGEVFTDATVTYGTTRWAPASG